MFIARDEILMIVGPRDGLDSLIVNITTGVKEEMVSIPNDDLP